jgi:nucleoside-diphosphate-sugar epimerase
MVEKIPSVLNLGSGVDLSLEDLIPLIFEAAGHKTDVEYVPARSVDVPRVRLDVSEIGRALGWKPTTTIEEGLQHTLDWIRAAGFAK